MLEFSMGQPGLIQMGDVGVGGNPELGNSSATLPNFNVALQKVIAGTASTRILFIGDSTTLGVGSNGSDTSGNWPSNSFPKKISDLFNAANVNSHWNSWFGGGFSGNPGSVPLCDARVTGAVSGAWSIFDSTHNSLGGGLLTASSSSSSISFLPTTNVDTFNMFYVNNGSGWGEFSFNINGGTATIVNVAGSGTGATAHNLISSSISGTLGSNTVNISQTGSGSVFFCGVEAFNSANKWVSVCNTGWGGATSGNWNSTIDNYAPATSVVASCLSPSLTVISLGINDWRNSVSTTTYSNNIQALITNYKAVGDVMLVSPPPSEDNVGAPVNSVQATYVAVLKALAASNNIPLVDVFNTWGTWATANANGWMTDNYHPNGTGYQLIANMVYNAIRAA